VIGTFVLNLSGSVNEQASAGVNVEAVQNTPGQNLVTVTSMNGETTDAVVCVSGGGVSSTATQVGASFQCPDGGAVVAKGLDGIEDKTIASNLNADNS
jgi:hypothetical protein